jgi:hypothetical protein
MGTLERSARSFFRVFSAVCFRFFATRASQRKVSKSSVLIGCAMPTRGELEAVRASQILHASEWLARATSNHTVNNGVSGACTSETYGASRAHRARVIHRAPGRDERRPARARAFPRAIAFTLSTRTRWAVVRCAPPRSARRHALTLVPPPPSKRRFSLSTRPCWPRYVAAHPRAPRVRRHRASPTAETRVTPRTEGFFPAIEESFPPDSGLMNAPVFAANATHRITLTDVIRRRARFRVVTRDFFFLALHLKRDFSRRDWRLTSAPSHSIHHSRPSRAAPLA